MKTIKIKPFGVEVNRTVPSTPTEYDHLAKQADACLRDALKYFLYHIDFSEIRETVLHGRKEDTAKNITAIKGMDTLFGMERGEKPALDKEGKPRKTADGTPITVWDEKEEAFYNKIVAEKKITEADQAALIQSIVDQIPFDPSATERVAKGPGKLANKYLESAKAVLKGGKLDAFSKELKKQIGKDFVSTGDEAKDADALGRLIKEYLELKEAQTLAKMTS